MRYSLMSRFQGVFLGSILGELIGVGCVKQTQPELQRSLLGGVTELLRKGHAQQEMRWSRVALLGAESLVRCGQLEIEDWNHELAVQDLLPMLRGSRGSEVAIGTLPIALFFHEHKMKGKQVLEPVLTSWQGATHSVVPHVLAYVIMQALQEQLHPHTLISQTIAHLQQVPSLEVGAIVPLLLQVQDLLQIGAGLSALAPLYADRSDEAAMALSFYCFLSTPDYPTLAFLRAAQIGYQPQSVCALVGALMGAYHGVMGFPAAWRLSLNQGSVPGSSVASGISSHAALNLGDRLFATWCGIYNPATPLLSPATAVAAPGVIRPHVSKPI